MPRSAGLGSLFERLDPDVPLLRILSRQEQVQERIRGIKQNLERILNTRQGCSASSPELGLRDFNNASLGSTDLQQRVGADIRRSIAAHEPRIKVVSVRVQPDATQPLNLHIRLDCLVPLQGMEEQMEIDLVVNGLDRLIRISG
ncbi:MULTISPECIES: type VI secretion system baseplate subunit TssE [Pseudomonas]|uniref:type VI secretion system baseplate subunit TssE n=1 Tax=Pseudomonas TaxID=286 RepID=UPI000EC03DCF|nr:MULTISPECIES: type VI secretion system baseplate subunit TssE [Pseudomonas]HAL66755.1 type VI secretion system baseplate subunit TssE [Pseudomonas sp.]MBF8677659.1 type VI secretion system baseplate subunit TssE [Pseudomonas fulva]MBF8719813.1 type VI secretion system baseplate subunit TssE [Pseudomonas fulva]MBF8767746.1 type VI secretion system baseplate subunit TssE [Pseudomonas putida]MBF8786020.1 type VI secretion system baseplate subunit TssE [Pseudomonas fulva]